MEGKDVNVNGMIKGVHFEVESILIRNEWVLKRVRCMWGKRRGGRNGRNT